VVNGVKNVINLLNLSCEGPLRRKWLVEFSEYFRFVSSRNEGDDLAVVMPFFQVLKFFCNNLGISDFVTNHRIQNLKVDFFLDPNTDMLHKFLVLGLIVVHTYLC
jgi:hypothetical protein